jgi:hypothetical protein
VESGRSITGSFAPFSHDEQHYFHWNEYDSRKYQERERCSQKPARAAPANAKAAMLPTPNCLRFTNMPMVD